MEWIITTPEMSHSGILGMHWGRRRYQNKDGSWTEAGKRRRREMSPDAKKRADRKNEAKNLKSKGELDTAKANLKITKAQNKAAVQEAKAGVKTLRGKIADKAKATAIAAKDAAKAKIEERKAAKKEATAEEIIRSGDMKKILQNKDKLTNEQLRSAADRMDLEQRLSSIDARQKQAGIDKYKRFADVVGTTANLTSNGINIYNNVAKVMNAFADKDLPTIGEKRTSDYDRRMNAARLRTAEAAAENAELNLRRARGQNANTSTNTQSSSSSQTSGSTESARPTSTHTGRQAGAERTRTRSQSSSESESSSSSASSVPERTHTGRQAGAERTRTRSSQATSELDSSADNAAVRGLRNMAERRQEMQRVRNQVRVEHGVNSDEYQRINDATNAMERVENLTSMRYRTRMNQTGLSETALLNAEREVDRLMSQARTEGVYRDLLGAEDILERYRNN